MFENPYESQLRFVKYGGKNRKDTSLLKKRSLSSYFSQGV